MNLASNGVNFKSTSLKPNGRFIEVQSVGPSSLWAILSLIMSQNMVRRDISTSMKVSRSGEKTGNKTVRSEKQRFVSQPRQAVDGR